MFGLGAYLLIVLFANILKYPELTKTLIYVSGITMFFDSLAGAFNSIFRAKKNLVYESMGIIGSQFITLLIGTFALLNHWPLVWLILAYAIPSFLKFNLHQRFSKKSLRHWRSFCLERPNLQNFYRHCLAVRFGGNYRTVLFL